MRHDLEDLAVLVDGPTHVPPHPSDLHVGLIDEPSAPDHMAGRRRRVDQPRGEPPDPPEHGHVIDVNAALSEELLDGLRFDNPYRKYQRTPRRITSGGNRNPENVDSSPTGHTGRRRRLTNRGRPSRPIRQRNCAHHRRSMDGLRVSTRDLRSVGVGWVGADGELVCDESKLRAPAEQSHGWRFE